MFINIRNIYFGRYSFFVLILIITIFNLELLLLSNILGFVISSAYLDDICWRNIWYMHSW